MPSRNRVLIRHGGKKGEYPLTQFAVEFRIMKRQLERPTFRRRKWPYVTRKTWMKVIPQPQKFRRELADGHPPHTCPAILRKPPIDRLFLNSSRGHSRHV